MREGLFACADLAWFSVLMVRSRLTLSPQRRGSADWRVIGQPVFGTFQSSGKPADELRGAVLASAAEVAWQEPRFPLPCRRMGLCVLRKERSTGLIALMVLPSACISRRTRGPTARIRRSPVRRCRGPPALLRVGRALRSARRLSTVWLVRCPPVLAAPTFFPPFLPSAGGRRLHDSFATARSRHVSTLPNGRGRVKASGLAASQVPPLILCSRKSLDYI